MSAPTPTFDSTIGALVVSIACACAFMGLVISLVVRYYTTFQHDPLVFKLLVGFLTAVALVETSINGSWTYNASVTNFANPASLAIIPWQMKQLPPQSGTVALIVQLFYCWRIGRIGSGFGRYRMTPWILPTIIALIALAGWSIVVWVGWYSFRLTTMDQLPGIFPVAYVWFACVISADVLITAALMYYLIFKVPKFSTTREVFLQIIYRAVQTNTLSLIFQVMIPPLLLTPEQSGFWYVLPGFLVTPIYVYSLVNTLVSRKGADVIVSSGSTPGHGVSDWRPTTQGGKGSLGGVQISRTQNITVDVESARAPWGVEGEGSDEYVGAIEGGGARKPVAIHFDQPQSRSAKDAMELRDM